MGEEEKYFDYGMRPGKALLERKSIFDGKPIISILQN